MKNLFYLIVILLVSAVCLLQSCTKDSPTEASTQLYRISWNNAEHYYGSGIYYLTITELWGPKGANIDIIIPGKYVAKGTYNLTGSSFNSGVISLGFIGTIITGENNRTAEVKTYTIPSGQLTGTYEVIQEIIRLESGPGNPCVDFIVDNTMYDRVTLY